MKVGICPRCGKTFDEDMAALSRADNKTLVCGECGMREAHGDKIADKLLALSALSKVFDEKTAEEDKGGVDLTTPQTEEANSSFIRQGCKCHFCGKASHWGTEYIVTIEGGYNSDHDMERVSMNVCARCLEKMLAAVN